MFIVRVGWHSEALAPKSPGTQMVYSEHPKLPRKDNAGPEHRCLDADEPRERRTLPRRAGNGITQGENCSINDSLRRLHPRISTAVDSGIARCCRAPQPSKVSALILVTELGILMLCRALQEKKAFSPISVTESGISIRSRALQPWKACFPMLVTESGILMLSRALQKKKTSSSILVRDSEISICFKPLQPMKAFLCMTLTGLGILMLSKAMQ